MKYVLAFILMLSPMLARAQTIIGYPTVPIVQSESFALNATSVSCGNAGTAGFDRNVTSGNLVLVVVSWFTTTNTPTVMDTLSTSYTQKYVNTGTSVKLAVFTGTLGSSGADKITASITSGAFINIGCAELSPNWTTTVDVSGVTTYTGTPSTVTAPNVTTTLKSDLVLTVAANDNNAGWQYLASANLLKAWPFGYSSNNDSQTEWLSLSGAVGTFTGLTFQNGGRNGTILTLAFQPNPLAINNPSTAPVGALSTSYSYTLLATGGNNTYTWSINSGSLPAGLSLNTGTGAITGTPTALGIHSVTFGVSDGTNTATKAISIPIGTLSSISFVQGKDASTTTGVTSLSFTSNVTSGDALAIHVGYNLRGNNITSCSDTLGTSFKLISVATYPAQNSFAIGTAALLAGFAPSSGADTITCATGAMNQIVEFANVGYLASDNIVLTSGSTVTPATVTSGSLVTLVPNELLVSECGAFTSGSVMSVTSPFTTIATPSMSIPARMSYDVVTSVTGYTSSCSYTGNTNGAWLFNVAGFRPGGTASIVSKIRHKATVY